MSFDKAMKKSLLMCFLILSILLYGQENAQAKITFQIDSIKVNEHLPESNFTPNDPDYAYLHFDGGFKNDTVFISIDNKQKHKKIFETEWSTGYAGELKIRKTKNMVISVRINDQVFESFKFDKNFTYGHFSFYGKKLLITYTNKIYIYE